MVAVLASGYHISERNGASQAVQKRFPGALTTKTRHAWAFDLRSEVEVKGKLFVAANARRPREPPARTMLCRRWLLLRKRRFGAVFVVLLCLLELLLLYIMYYASYIQFMFVAALSHSTLFSYIACVFDVFMHVLHRVKLHYCLHLT